VGHGNDATARKGFWTAERRWWRSWGTGIRCSSERSLTGAIVGLACKVKEKRMQQSIGLVSLLVRDYDEALAFYVGKLGFDLVEDTPLPEGKRWVVVGPPGAATKLLLAKAADGPQSARVGDQTGGRVFLFLDTDDFQRDFQRFSANGVT
jgi:predicted enzyme related to lactoylglutathione lyase